MITKKPLAVVLGAAFAFGGAAAQAAVFQATDLSSGYMVASTGDDKSGEQKCGEGKCGEGKCGEKKKEGGEGKCGEKKAP